MHLYIIHCLRLTFHNVSVITFASIFRLKGKSGDLYLTGHLVGATLLTSRCFCTTLISPDQSYCYNIVGK